MTRVRGIHVLLVGTALYAGASSRATGAESTSGEPMGAGVAVAEITPEGGAVHDPLWAKAIVFRQGDCQAALVMCDQVGVSPELSRQVREEAARRAGIPAAHVAVAATHTHTGRSCRKDTAKRIVEAIVNAQAAAVEARVQTCTTEQQETISFNRRYLMTDGTIRFNPGFLNPDIVRPVGPIDPEVGILLIRDAQTGKPLFSLANFALHLDTVGRHDQLSADYPYYLESGLREEFGDDFTSVFGPGTCGDVNHFDVNRPRASGTQTRGQTMLTTYTPKPTDASPSPLNAEYIGKALAATVKAAIPKAKDVDKPALAVRSRIIRAPLATYSDMDLAWAKEAAGSRMSFLMGVRARRILSLAELRQEHGDAMPVEVQAFRISSDTAIVTLPGEVFVELGLAIKRQSPFANTLVIELANSNQTRYVPTRKAFCEGDYEVVNSRLESGGGEMMVEAAAALLEELKDDAR